MVINLNKNATGPTFINSGVVFVSLVGGLLVLAGFLTQIGTAVLLLLSAYLAYAKRGQTPIFLSLFAIALSLLFSGAGAFAFDLPL